MSRKYKKLILQYSFLKLEKEDVEELSDKAAIELEKAYREKYGEYKIKPQKPENINDTKESKDKEIQEDISDPPKNKDLRKLYRKIASATHPDKTKDIDLSDVFDQAARAYENDDLAELLDIAGNLNIEIIELSPESVVLLKINIDNISKKIDTLKENTAWYWANATTEEEKDKILEFVYNFRKGENK